MSVMHSPRTVAEAIDLLRSDAHMLPVAGCTDLMVARPKADTYLNLLQIDDLHGIDSEGESLRIGATTTFREIAAYSLIRERLPILAQAAMVVGAWQIQNRATIGGNVVNASPAGDSLPVLLALDASALIAGPDGEREVPYSAFHLGYRQTALGAGEILVGLRLPIPTEGTIQAFRKVGARAAQAISKVVVAFAADFRDGHLFDVRFAAGSVAATPIRLHATESLCEGAALNEALTNAAGAKASAEVQPINDIRSTADYRRWILGRLVRRMLLTTTGERA